MLTIHAMHTHSGGCGITYAVGGVLYAVGYNSTQGLFCWPFVCRYGSSAESLDKDTRGGTAAKVEQTQSVQEKSGVFDGWFGSVCGDV